MKYKVLYDTLINKSHHQRGAIIEFPNGTDEGYIKRLVTSKVIAPVDIQGVSKEKSQERIELEAKAKELGIPFKDNTKDETLREKISKATQSLDSEE
ncbi:hypothetical protein [uncultured Helicobacter sp.]|uniref:hypothetical protein n=1 Tax=uncultured Helicobacter sp. TaxID=175537 RepID=UPI0026256E61|nr:hypothetical protein [uncultured Helicobacter sp.]